ncbi:FtsX-like permease family protein [Luteolibacter luteus]|uniref:ABC transporter permease n=1 Tax=Luteolibacter luteus TaxID=2728835 RepID=A0A858RJI5_9BACT|nr:FtsX-like permease family protein [Luteolibacter luteus]QJE96638.1 ABC transporter permease [Luteolibacter luteus]
MARRSFSLMLAWRYLNPRRAMLSAVTLISVTGVLLGVLVLVVVMAVYAGLERTVKDRLLGFTPHVKLEYVPFGGFREPISDWRETADKIKQVPGVHSATAFVQEYVLMIDEATRKRPVFFRGVDTQDPSQVTGLEKLLDEDYPGSSADMGLDNRIVISSIIAKQFGLHPGDKVKFLSAQNLNEMERIDRIRKRPALHEEFAAQLGTAKEGLKTALTPHEGKLLLKNDDYNKFFFPLTDVYNIDDIRDPEREILGQFLALFESGNTTNDGVLLDSDVPQKATEALDELDKVNVKELNAEILDGFMEIVLPKEATVIGVYGASQMALTPDVFMPLPLAQELAGLQGAVQGIAVRLDDPYQAHITGQKFASMMPPGWHAVTWMEEFGEFSNLINQQRVMMYFALSFIILVSAFSMMAVMFTVTIQKRREIGVMKALGAAPGQIVRVFVNQGMILGFVGSVLGVVSGLVVIRFRGTLQDVLRGFGFDPFPKSFHGFQVLPAHVNPMEVTVIAIAAFILCSLAAFVPAFFAARSDAAKSLRNL